MRFKLLVTALLLLAVAGTLWGQEAKGLKAKTSYDHKTDKTTISVGPVALTDNNTTGGRFILTAFFTYPAQTPSRPKYVVLLFTHNGDVQDSCARTKKCELEIVADDQRWSLGAPQVQNSQARPSAGGATVMNETLLAGVSLRAFNQIANAKAVTLNIGPRAIHLDPKLLAGLHELNGDIPPETAAR